MFPGTESLMSLQRVLLYKEFYKEANLLNYLIKRQGLQEQARKPSLPDIIDPDIIDNA